MVIWLMGVSGSGKTTLGERMKGCFDSMGTKSYIIDGDLVRTFYDNDLGYGKEDRVSNIKRIMFSCYVLESNGIIPIVCNISPYQNLRNFAKEKFKNYEEIYLKRDMTDIKNKNHVYQGSNVVGVDLEFEVPKSPSLIVNTSELSIEESFQKIIKYIESKINEH